MRLPMIFMFRFSNGFFLFFFSKMDDSRVIFLNAKLSKPPGKMLKTIAAAAISTRKDLVYLWKNLRSYDKMTQKSCPSFDLFSALLKGCEQETETERRQSASDTAYI